MAISKIKGSAIQDATIPEEKLEDEAGSFRMILDGTDGSATNAGDFLLLDATASSTNVGEQFLFEPATDDGSAVLSSDAPLVVSTVAGANGENATAMTIDSDGVVKITQNPCFFIHGTNGAHVTTSPIPFGFTKIDTRRGVDLANNKYVVPIAGKWHFHLQLGIVAATGTGNCYPYIRRTDGGGSATLLGYSYFNPVNSSGVTSYSTINVNVIVDCAVGDSIDNTFVQTTATYYNDSAECRFFGYFLG